MYDPRINGWNSKFQYPPTYEDDVEQPLRARVEALEAGGGGGGGGSPLRVGAINNYAFNPTMALTPSVGTMSLNVGGVVVDNKFVVPADSSYLEVKVNLQAVVQEALEVNASLQYYFIESDTADMSGEVNNPFYNDARTYKPLEGGLYTATELLSFTTPIVACTPGNFIHCVFLSSQEAILLGTVEVRIVA